MSLERFFRRLVDNLIAIDPARLHRPLTLSDLTQTILPYRANRRALDLSSNEDYDLGILRMCAGEGGYLRTEPAEVQTAFAAQVASLNPDLSILRDLGETQLYLATEQLAYALGPEPGTVYAPPDEDESEAAIITERHDSVPDFDAVRRPRAMIEPVPLEEFEQVAGEEMETSHPEGRCSYCGGSLPQGRSVNFCPHCGESQSFIRCPSCQTDVELGWKHCITCGAAIQIE